MVGWVYTVPEEAGSSPESTVFYRALAVPGFLLILGLDTGCPLAPEHEWQGQGIPCVDLQLRNSCKVPWLGTQPRLTCTQALKTLKSVKGSPWSLSSGRRAVAQSRLLWALRVNGDWMLRAAAMVSTGSARLNREPRISIFPVGGSGRAKPRESDLPALGVWAPARTSFPLLPKNLGSQTDRVKPQAALCDHAALGKSLCFPIPPPKVLRVPTSLGPRGPV